MVLAIEYFQNTSSDVSNNGVFIDFGELPGVGSTELASGNAETEGKVMLSILEALYNRITDGESPLSVLGLAVTKPNPVGVGTNIWNQTYGHTLQFVADQSDNTLYPIPVPGSGTNNGVGKLAIKDVFPSAVKITAADSPPNPGVVITSATLAQYGAPAHGSLSLVDGADNRDWWFALLLHMFNSAVLRTADTAAVLTAKTRSNATGVTPPAAFTQVTNPTSGLVAADLGKISLFSVTYAFTLQLIADQSTQTFDVRSVTA